MLEPEVIITATERIEQDHNSPYYYGGGAIQTKNVADCAWITPSLNKIVIAAKINLGHEYDIKHAWINSTPPGGYVRAHLHYGVDISGVLYLQCSDDCGDLILVEPRPMFKMTRDYTKNSDTRIRPHVGGFVLFPSWLEHEVEPNKSMINRISVAFDLIKRE